MNKIISILLLCSVANSSLPAQEFYFPRLAVADSTGLVREISFLAKQLIPIYKSSNSWDSLNNLFRLQALIGDYSSANSTIYSLREILKRNDPLFDDLLFIQFELYNSAKGKQAATGQPFREIFSLLFNTIFSSLDDKKTLYTSTAFITRNGVVQLQGEFEKILVNNKNKDSLTSSEAITLCNNYYLWQVYNNIESLSKQLVNEDDAKRYIIEDSVIIKTKNGISLSAIVARRRTDISPQPTALVFTIYAEENNTYQAKIAAAYGYVGVVGLTRGKGHSTNEIVPYQYEVTDVNSIIDWIIKQPWSNGKIGMYGGSYNGFSQWAATKRLHKALKTIVPYVAAIPGQGLPMENNVFLNANYGWAFYVTNNRYLDNKIYYDPQRWNAIQDKWYTSGVAYNKIDSIDGTPNKWLQRWLKHPDYDKYWQSIVPYQQDYAKINIPVLSITGYYDDGQISALHYLKEHYKYNKKADHYLIIGPYDHFGAQRGGSPVLRDYTVDPIALINTREITFEWLDYVLKNGKKPELLKDKINYEVMGANIWKHAPSLEKMSNDSLTLYLTSAQQDSNHLLTTKKPGKPEWLTQEVDFMDRTKTNNNNYYPFPIVRKELNRSSGLFFISEPFNEPITINGTFSGKLKAMINKKDMDIGVVLYEVMPNGDYFNLSYFLGRASYALSMSTRKLLTPGKIETISFERTRMVSRQLSKGSRLLVILDINKGSFAQINYGTGKDISQESIKDAKEPLKIKWYGDSFIKIPISR